MRRSFVFIISLIAFVFSIAAIIITFTRIIPTVSITGETYAGVFISILGILVTVVLGYQIYSTLDIKDSIKELDDLKRKLQTAEQELENTKKDILAVENRIQAGRLNSEGISAGEDYALALCKYTSSLIFSLKCDYAELIPLTVSNIETSSLDWNSGYNPDSSRQTIRGKLPRHRFLELFEELTINYSEHPLLSLYIDKIKEARDTCVEKLQEHDKRKSATKK